jgi:RES domain-containing protein
LSWNLESVGGVTLGGIFWRMLAPRWSYDPLSGVGAARAGGRWNEQGQAALYLSETHAVAIAEYQQDLPRPGTLTGYEVEANAILDITDNAVRTSIGIDASFLKQAWKQDRDISGRRPACWDFVRQVADQGWTGLRVPSAQGPGNNLVLWHWNTDGGADVRVIDPASDLPRNQSSWISRI